MTTLLKKIMAGSLIAISSVTISACIYETPKDEDGNAITDRPSSNLGIGRDSTCEYKDPDYFAGGQNRTTKLRVYNAYKATAENPAPVMVYFHGGGATNGNYKTGVNSNIRAFTNKDDKFVVISAQYRLTDAKSDTNSSPAVTPPERQAPAQLIDAKAAINCVKQMDFIDPERVYATGYSAGATIAMLAALTPGLHEPEPTTSPVEGNFAGYADNGITDVWSTIAIDPPIDIRKVHADLSGNLSGQKVAGHLLCGSADCVPTEQQFDEASPMTFANPDTPIFIACGDTPADVLGEGFENCTDGIEYYENAGLFDLSTLEEELNLTQADYNENVWVNITDRDHFFISYFGVHWPSLRAFATRD